MKQHTATLMGTEAHEPKRLMFESAEPVPLDVQIIDRDHKVIILCPCKSTSTTHGTMEDTWFTTHSEIILDHEVKTSTHDCIAKHFLDDINGKTTIVEIESQERSTTRSTVFHTHKKFVVSADVDFTHYEPQGYQAELLNPCLINHYTILHYTHDLQSIHCHLQNATGLCLFFSIDNVLTENDKKAYVLAFWFGIKPATVYNGTLKIYHNIKTLEPKFFGMFTHQAQQDKILLHLSQENTKFNFATQRQHNVEHYTHSWTRLYSPGLYKQEMINPRTVLNSSIRDQLNAKTFFILNMLYFGCYEDFPYNFEGRLLLFQEQTEVKSKYISQLVKNIVDMLFGKKKHQNAILLFSHLHIMIAHYINYTFKVSDDFLLKTIRLLSFPSPELQQGEKHTLHHLVPMFIVIRKIPTQARDSYHNASLEMHYCYDKTKPHIIKAIEINKCYSNNIYIFKNIQRTIIVLLVDIQDNTDYVDYILRGQYHKLQHIIDNIQVLFNIKSDIIIEVDDNTINLFSYYVALNQRQTDVVFGPQCRHTSNFTHMPILHLMKHTRNHTLLHGLEQIQV